MRELENIQLANLSNKYVFVTHCEFNKIQELVKQLQQELDKYKAKEERITRYIYSKIWPMEILDEFLDILDRKE